MKAEFLLTIFRKKTVEIKKKKKTMLLCFVSSEACSLVIALVLQSRVTEEGNKNWCIT